MKMMKMKNSNISSDERKSRVSPIITGLALALALVLVLSGCATTTLKYEVPFGSEMEAGPFVVSSQKTGEGEFVITITSSVAENLDVDIRMRRTEIGYDYSTNRSGSDPYFYTSFEFDKPRRTIPSGDIVEFHARMKNKYQISRYFYTVAYINIRGEDSRWKLDIRIEDEYLYKDIEYLRQLNRIDYWHPKLIQENWDKYLEHIGE